jgi:hypothetical protein
VTCCITCGGEFKYGIGRRSDGRSQSGNFHVTTRCQALRHSSDRKSRRRPSQLPVSFSLPALDAPCLSRIPLKHHGTCVDLDLFFSSPPSFSSLYRLASSPGICQPTMSRQTTRRLCSSRIPDPRDSLGALPNTRYPTSWMTRSVAFVRCCRAKAALYEPPWQNTNDDTAVTHPRALMLGGALRRRIR